MSWPEIALGHIAEFRNGLNYTTDNEGEGLRIINVKNFGDKSFPDYDELSELNPHGILRDEALLKHGDIIFVRSNGNKDLVGRSLFVNNPPENVSFSAFCIRARLNSSVDPRFYSYFFRTPNFRKRLALLGKGTNISNLNQQVLKRIIVPNPSNEEKSRIVSLICTYDDLIENNRRRIQLLEQAARLLYKEWFVYLRFPGHEHVKIVDGVPEGWEKKPFSDLATFLNGFAFKPAHLGDVGLPIVKIPELRNGPTEKTPKNTGEHIPEKYLLDNGDILFSWSGTLLVNIWNHGNGLLNQHLFKVTPVSDNLRGLVYFALKQALAEFQNQTIGATMKHIRKGALENVSTLIPNAVILDEFESTVATMLKQISVLQRQTTNVVKARDILLPRLMNGELPL